MRILTHFSARLLRLTAVTIVLLMTLNGTVFGASNINEQVRQVETSLTRKIHIRGEPIQKWTIADRLQNHNVPGVSVAVVSDGRLAWARGFAVANAEAAPVTPETLFQAASISKTVAAMVALRLVEMGKLSLDEDVNEKLKTWKLPNSDALQGEHVTLRKILSHTAGLTVHGFPGYARGAPLPTLPQLLDGVKPANSQPVRVDIKPGTQMRYSGGGYEVMQLLIEDVTGKPFAQIAHELVLQPLGMTHSTYEQPLPPPLQPHAATAYNEEGIAIPGEWHIYPEQAAAGLWTTPSDLTKVILEIQKPGHVLSERTVQLMLTPVLDHWGLGLQLSETNGRKAFQHGGANMGFRCLMFGYRDGGQGAVVMTNSDNGIALAGEIFSSISAIYGWPDFKPAEKSIVSIPAEKLTAYAGTYEVPGHIRIKVTVKGDKLYFQPTGYPKSELFPQSEDTFFDPDGVAPDIHFERLTDGNFQISGGGLVAKRVQ